MLYVQKEELPLLQNLQIGSGAYIHWPLGDIFLGIKV
jgi:hypothetical protein